MQRRLAGARYVTLDGMRGVAAFAVVVLHIREAFGGYHPEHAYLAVDLFFAMSGFVLASNYDDKLKTGQMSPPMFMTHRFIRLWPLFALSIVIVMIEFMTGNHGALEGATPTKMTISMILSLVLIPFPFTLTTDLYPLNSPGWSLFYELVANYVYSFFNRFLSNYRLAVITGLCYVALLLSIIFLSRQHQISAGLSLWTLPIGLARVGFAFSAGILAFRLFKSRRSNLGLPIAPATHNIYSCLFVLLVGFILLFPISNALNIVLVPGLILIIPLIVYCSANYNPSGFLSKIFAILGDASYGIYVIHVSIGFLAYNILKQMLPERLLAPAGGLILCLFLLVTSLLVDKIYDAPLRKMLNRLSAATLQSRRQREMRGGPSVTSLEN